MFQFKSRSFTNSAKLFALFSILVAALAGCGGGGGGGSGGGSFAYPTTFTGVASKGPLNGSTVCAYPITGGVKGAMYGNCATNIVNGNFYINIGPSTGPILFEATGGSYIDEATGLSVALTSPLRSILSNAPANMSGNTTPIAITPLTELAYQAAIASVGGLTTTNIQAAVSNVQANFGVADYHQYSSGGCTQRSSLSNPCTENLRTGVGDYFAVSECSAGWHKSS
jgi:hypothetical protein